MEEKLNGNRSLMTRDDLEAIDSRIYMDRII